jgi:hypothetical protein
MAMRTGAPGGKDVILNPAFPVLFQLYASSSVNVGDFLTAFCALHAYLLLEFSGLTAPIQGRNLP